jgi:NADH-quinone oxidoreductase subunit N
MSTIVLLSILGVVLIYMGLGSNRQPLAPTAIAGLVAALVLTWTGWDPGLPQFPAMFEVVGMARLFNCTLISVALLIFLFGIDYYARDHENVAEQFALMVFSLTGALLLTSWTNLLMLFLGIEILSIPLYILAGARKRSLRSSEASFKYFLMGSFASAFLLMGIALIYGVTATFDLHTIAEKMGAAGGTDILFVLGCFFTAVGLAFKVAAAPFHFWSPDVYEGSPTIVTAFMATVVKTAAFAALYRFVHMTAMPAALATALLVMTVLTLFVGNVVALRQSHFKRLMAYSSIAHSGFLLLAVLSGGGNAQLVLYYYLTTYAVGTVGLFVLMMLAKRAANGDENVRIFRGLFRAKPWLAVMLLLMMLSMAGIPFTAGFIAKYQVFMLAIGADHFRTGIFAVVMALVGIYYYAVVIREAFTPAEEAPALVVSPVNLALISLCGIAVVALGVWPMGLF